MKTKLLAVALPLFLGGVLLTSCDEKTKQDIVVVDEDVDTTKVVVDGDAADAVEVEVREDWDKFRVTSNEAIQKSEAEMKTLREKIAEASESERAKLNKNLDELEKKNNELKAKIDARAKEFNDNMVEFNEEAKEKQREWSREMNHDLDEMGKAINNFFTNDKK